MVRFSDLLGGQETPEEKPVAAVPLVVEDAEAPGVAALPEESDDDVPGPEDVLERLTQYATSARAADQVPDSEPTVEPAFAAPDPAPGPDPEPEAGPVSFAPVADDLLPRPKGKRRS